MSQTVPQDATTHYRTCPFCEACCGLELKVAGGKVVSVRGNENDVFSQGYICPKGVALADLHEDPDRLRKPMIKRNGVFAEASWEEAFAEVERRLLPIRAAHGKDAVGVVIGNPSVHKASLLMYFPRLGKALGTTNIFSASTLDQMPRQLSAGLMYGHWLSIPVPDIERTDYLLVIGANPIVSNGSMWTVPDFRGRARAMKARGGKLVVVDPRRTETAAAADEHFFIRPGSDVFFLLGLVRVLFDENLIRLGRIEPHVAGLDDVRAALAPFSLDALAARCGVASGTIKAIARDLAKTPRAAVYGRMGTTVNEFGTLSSWLIDVVNILTGHLDEPGGVMFAKAPAFAANTMGKPGVGGGISTGRRHSRVSNAPEVFGEFPIGCLAEEIETEGERRLRALVTVAANPVLSAPNGQRLSGALDKLDFMISLDIYLNETSRHADVILPGLSPLEDIHYDSAFPQLGYRNWNRFSHAVFEAPEGQLPEWQIILHLCAILDGRGPGADVLALDDELVLADVRRIAGPQADAVMAALGTAKGPERLIDLGLRSGPYGDMFGLKPAGLNLAKLKAEPNGIDLGSLEPRLPEVLRTMSGKVELAPPSLIADLTRARSDLGRAAPPLVIIGRRHVRSNNSWMHNLPVLAKGPNRCTVLVHPEDAARHGVRHGGKARLTCSNRAIEAEVEVSDEMMPGVISLPHGWGHDAAGARLKLAGSRPGANLNALFDEHARDPLSGTSVLNGVPVEMHPAA